MHKTKASKDSPRGIYLNLDSYLFNQIRLGSFIVGKFLTHNNIDKINCGW